MFSLEEGSSCFAFPRGAFRWYMSFKVFASQLGNMHSDLPPLLLRPNCLKDPVAPNEEHKRYSFGNSSAYTVCFSFKQVICLQARWIAGLHGWLSALHEYWYHWKILLICVCLELAQPFCFCQRIDAFPQAPVSCFSCSELYDQSWLHGLAVLWNFGLPRKQFIPVNESKSA